MKEKKSSIKKKRPARSQKLEYNTKSDLRGSRHNNSFDIIYLQVLFKNAVENVFIGTYKLFRYGTHISRIFFLLTHRAHA